MYNVCQQLQDFIDIQLSVQTDLQVKAASNSQVCLRQTCSNFQGSEGAATFLQSRKCLLHDN